MNATEVSDEMIANFDLTKSPFPVRGRRLREICLAESIAKHYKFSLPLGTNSHRAANDGRIKPEDALNTAVLRARGKIGQSGNEVNSE